ncbi:four-carbon acid sugar kinase family protein [Echinicola strongylocentroti]|uniref:Four-carbon acid sugar kinase family protein n=1 Tax=Echinicola strongylocentroti TaxID=1795355 RepID=A0A2Z4IIK9_9BACT|nr:four-carbon acid sugar kinase family protein [Echinicola strongylocentroti]AWW30569.1 four-carbon acid sugar kinase family protein [Echinicola strongylocentroti]
MIAVIADDITGAAEIAGVCLRWGIPVSFSLDASPASGAEVMVIATDTRSMAEAEALKETDRIASMLMDMGITWIFKKSDSVMRGHVSKELKVLAKRLHKEKMLLVPANPYTGRSISDGIYYVKGRPLNETSFKDDPTFPAFSANVKDLLREDELSVAYGRFSEEGDLQQGFNIPDSQTMQDLYTWASLMDNSVLPAGSAAFFEMCLKRNFPEWMRGQEPDPLSFVGNSLMIAGSSHQNSKDFVEKAVEKGVHLSEMPELLIEEEYNPAGTEAWVHDVGRGLLEGNRVIMAYGKKKASFKNYPAILKKRTAQAVARVIEEVPVRELLLEGGATTCAVIEELSLGALIPMQELSPGVVRLKAVDHDMVLTIKPGSYAWPEAVYRYFELEKPVV